MNTLNTLKTQWKKAVVLGVVTLTPALALTGNAQAAPRHDSAPNQQNWNDHRDNNHDDRFDHNGPSVHGHFDSHPNYGQNYDRNDHRFDDHRFDNRYDYRYDDHRHDYRYDNHGSDTGKILGAGIVGAVLGAVLSR